MPCARAWPPSPVRAGLSHVPVVGQGSAASTTLPPVGGPLRLSTAQQKERFIVTTTFSQLSLIEPILRALHQENYTSPTPIQAQAIPHLLAGRDLLGIAQTGTGKTAAFGLPILQRLFEDRAPAGPKGARALILTPTRELAIQIGESLRGYGRHLHLRLAGQRRAPAGVLAGGTGFPDPRRAR